MENRYLHQQSLLVTLDLIRSSAGIILPSPPSRMTTLVRS